MSSFSLEWLQLRRSADLRARNITVEETFCEWLNRHAANTEELRLVDLAAGTGAAMQALARKIGAERQQEWFLVEQDEDLLTFAGSSPMPLPTINVHSELADIRDESTFAIFESKHAVVTSALLDLVDDTWLDLLVAHVTYHGLPFLASLSFNGEIVCTPPHGYDSFIFDAVNRHQRTNKGFGPALGPIGWRTAMRKFERHAYRLIAGQSNWQCRNDEKPLQCAIVDGWVIAALEDGMPAQIVEDWKHWRYEAIERGISTIHVGHMDFAALPA